MNAFIYYHLEQSCHFFFSKSATILISHIFFVGVVAVDCFLFVHFGNNSDFLLLICVWLWTIEFWCVRRVACVCECVHLIKCVHVIWPLDYYYFRQLRHNQLSKHVQILNMKKAHFKYQFHFKMSHIKSNNPIPLNFSYFNVVIIMLFTLITLVSCVSWTHNHRTPNSSIQLRKIIFWICRID